MILPEVDDSLLLTLTRDNPSNTTLVSQADETLYSIVTEHAKKTSVTSVRNARDEVIASLEWRDVRPDRVTYGNKKQVSMADWMKKSVVPFKDDITFTDDDGRKYKWKGNSAGRSFELYTADDNFKSTIARFYPSRRVLTTPITPNSSSTNPCDSTPTLVNPPSTPGWTSPVLELSPRAMQIQDLVVTSFLFLEKTRRTNENESTNRTRVTPLRAGLGGGTMAGAGIA